ncbi:MAG: DNA internalization-related competence protein ComEC/Rec2 [Luteimonas sp.]
MQDAARKPPGSGTQDLPLQALALLSGAGACLLLPRLPPWPWLAAAFAVGFGLWLRGGRGRLVGVFACGLGLAGLHAASILAQQLPMSLEQHEVTIDGRVLDLPQREARRTRFAFQVDADASQPAALRGKRLQLAWYDDFDVHPPRPPRLAVQAGSRWRLCVRLRAPRGLRNPGGFDGEKQALADRIAATGYLGGACAVRLTSGRGIDGWRERVSARIAEEVPDPASRFIRALAIGDTRGIGDDDWDVLRAVGVTHLIAISGFHVGIVAGFFALVASLAWRLFPRLGHRIPRQHAAAAAAVVGALAYAAVAGFALPTVRTLLMIAVVASARLMRRAQRMVDVLALSMMAILLVDPLALLAAGFWLSFAGVAWLLWCLPPGTDRSWRAVMRGFLGAQAVATVGLLPLGVALFGQASLAGPLANLLAIPWWSLVVVPLALLGTGLDALHHGLGGVPWRLAASLFDLSWPVFTRLAESPLALAWLPEPRWFAVPLALAGAFWLLLPRGVVGKRLALLLWLPLLWPDRGIPRNGDADVTVLDVGQGLSVLVRTADHALLYDMGPAIPDGFDAGDRVVVPALHAMGVRRLDMAVVSHGDNDHAGGFPAVARAFPPALALTPDGAPLLPHGRACLAGMHWRWDGVNFRFLHPPRYFPYLGNDAGCVLRIAGAHGTLLLTADIDAVVERDLLRRDPASLRADVVVVAHHGSNGSSDASFIAATGAREALISAGYGNRFHHPRPEAVQRWRDAGARVRVTMATGALHVRLGPDAIQVEERRRSVPRLWDAAFGRPE